jgi:hypothetical protein
MNLLSVASFSIFCFFFCLLSFAILLYFVACSALHLMQTSQKSVGSCVARPRYLEMFVIEATHVCIMFGSKQEKLSQTRFIQHLIYMGNYALNGTQSLIQMFERFFCKILKCGQMCLVSSSQTPRGSLSQPLRDNFIQLFTCSFFQPHG